MHFTVEAQLFPASIEYIQLIEFNGMHSISKDLCAGPCSVRPSTERVHLIHTIEVEDRALLTSLNTQSCN